MIHSQHGAKAKETTPEGATRLGEEGYDSNAILVTAPRKKARATSLRTPIASSASLLELGLTPAQYRRALL